nr:YaaA family protein [Mangrovivirga cuniculi]
MITIISPSKTQDFSDVDFKIDSSVPEFLNESKKLVKELKKLSVPELESLMDISKNLAELNSQRYDEFKTPFNEGNAKQALAAFKGDVYTGFDLESYSESDFEFAQDHLRILSGLYGLLKPLDLIQPYRLEMKTKLGNERGKTFINSGETGLRKN